MGGRVEKKELDKYLESIYYDENNPASFGGLDRIYRFVKNDGRYVISKRKIKEWLQTQLVYVHHKPVKKNFKRLRVIVPRKYYQFDGDTVSMLRYEEYNGGYKYILVLIDILSRFAWTYPLKTLTGKEMVTALKACIDTTPTHLRTDHGSEFVNNNVSKFLKSRNIGHIVTLNEKKANYAERFIKTLKNKITRYMQFAREFKWVKALPKITAAYNKAYHRSIRMTPYMAMKTDDPKLWIMQYSPKKIKVKTKPKKQVKSKAPYTFRIGNKVKLSYLTSPFTKTYDEKWTTEMFIITGREIKQGIAQYTLKDWNNDPIRGTFYEQELQQVTIDDGVYNIEKVLKRRVRNKKKEVLVRWEGYNKNFDSWIAESDIKNLSNKPL